MFVFFDAVGTLLSPRPDVVSVYLTHGRAFGSRLTAAEIRESFSRLYRQHFSRSVRDAYDQQTSEDRERQRWANLVSELFFDVASPSELFDSLWNHFAQASNWDLFPDVVATLDYLAQQGIPWGIASNFDRRLEPIVAAHAELGAARIVVTSAAAGWSKPAVEFYQWAASAAAASTPTAAHDLWMIGDDWQLDVIAARSAGWKAIHLDRRGESAKSPECIQSLLELTSVWPDHSGR